MADSTYKEYLLSINNFGRSKVLTNEQAIAALLTRLILLEPGTNPLMPTMGVGIVSKYRYLFSSSAEQLKKDIQDQVNTFLPQANFTNVELIYNSDNSVDIAITIDDVTYMYRSSDLVPITLQDIATSWSKK